MSRGEPQAGCAAPQLLLLGAPVLRHAQRETALLPERRFQLLALLALRSGQWMARDEAAALLWPERASADARRNLRHVVFKARETAGGDDPQANEDALRWTVTTDLQHFHAALAQRRLADALALHSGPLLLGLETAASTEFMHWLQGERARVDSLWHQAAIEQLAALASQSAQRAALAQDLLARDTCDEAAVAALIDIELGAGKRSGAGQHYRTFASRLAEQLRVEPSHRLRDLLKQAGAAAAPAPVEHSFIGRRVELADVARRLADPACRSLTIVGPGGVGKGSLARQALAAARPESTWVELQEQ